LKKKRRPPLKKSMPREEEENARHKLTMILKRVKRRGNDIDSGTCIHLLSTLLPVLSRGWYSKELIVK
jgi:hypothetical protein